ncbi:MAG: hypothetical protein HEQ40_10455 [Lacibacter sp.]|jgi:hypothetical protein
MTKPLLLLAGMLACVLTSFSQPVIDGVTNDALYTVQGTASANNGFGTGNDLGVIKSYASTTALYVAITGRLNSNNNIVLFMDFNNYNGRGGNTLGGSSSSSSGVFSTSTAPGDCGGNGGLNGAIMDAGFDADYALAFNEGNGTSNLFLDGVRFGSGSAGYITTTFIGQTPNQTGGSVTTALNLGGTGNIVFAYRNDYDPSTAAERGIELMIPYTALPGVNYLDQVRFFAVITNGFGFMSDESIPGTITGGNPGCDANLSGQASTLFTGFSSLPVGFTQWEARRNGNTVQLSWQAEETEALQYYEVERSADATRFSPVQQLQRRNNSGRGSYTWVDEAPGSGKVFYRIAAHGANGNLRYSPLLRVEGNESKPQFKVIPAGNALALQLIGVRAGTYQLSVMNNSGQLLWSQNLVHDGSNRSFLINTTAITAGGLYRIVLRGNTKVLQQTIFR